MADWFTIGAGLGLVALLSLVAVLLVLRRRLALQVRHEQQRSQTENERLEFVVAQRTAQLTELALHLQTAREDERQRLARDLHDELGALLTSAKLDAARIRSRLAGSAPEALERLSHLVGTLDGVIALKRRVIEDLRPSGLSHLGLVTTLEILLREFAERSGLRVHSELAAVPLPADAEIVVYRLVQEAVNNISKHAHAGQIWVGLGLHEGRVRVTVRDDGAGFDALAQPRSAYGLMGMRFRIEAAQGRLLVSSAPGQGTCIEATLPAAVQPERTAA